MLPDHEPEPDDVKRGRDGRRMNPASLANLQPGAGAGRVGQAPALRHGARSHSPQHSPEWSPAVELAAADLAGRVGAELRDDAGELQPWAVPSIEAVAVLRVALARVERWTADREARGKYEGADDERVSNVAERYHRALEREALTLRSRIDARAQAMAQADPTAVLSDPDRGRRAAGMRAMGLTVDAEAEAEEVPGV